MAFRSESELHAFVEGELQHVKIGYIVRQTDIKNMRCGDPVFGKANPNIEFALVGGVANAHLNGWLERFIAARRGNEGILEGHVWCGFLHYHGYRTKEAQYGLIMAIRDEVIDMNSYYGTSFEVPDPEEKGSAQPFMDD